MSQPEVSEVVGARLNRQLRI